MSWMWVVWLGCGSPLAEEAAHLADLEARVVELEAQLEARQATADAASAYLDTVRERREQRLRELEDERDGPPPATLREALGDPEGVMRSTRALRHRGADGNYEGFRLSAVRPGGLADRLGFRDDDVVRRIDGRPVTTVEALTEVAMEVVLASGRFEVAFLRDGAPQTVMLDLDAPLPPPTTEELPPPATVRELLNDPERLATLGRALLFRGPDGEYNGYRLSGLRRNSPLDLLGFKNGDVVHEVAGVPVTGLLEAEEALAAAQGADAFDVVLSRQGERLSVTLQADVLLPLDRVPPEGASTSPEPSDPDRTRARRDERLERIEGAAAAEATEAPAPATDPLDAEELQKRREARLQRLRELHAERRAAEGEAEAGDGAP